ncbi:unnamed protein product [Urochloa humidicola]
MAVIVSRGLYIYVAIASNPSPTPQFTATTGRLQLQPRHLVRPHPSPPKPPPNLRLHFRPCPAPCHGVPAAREIRPPRAQIRRNEWTARRLYTAVMEHGGYGRSGVRARPRPEGLADQVAAACGAGGGGRRARPSAWISAACRASGSGGGRRSRPSAWILTPYGLRIGKYHVN